jgi:phosphatidylserine/phosphatidylglycerophosphate/cardiolipin synthase-like enzyme
VHIGEATNDLERHYAQYWRELQRRGVKVCATYAAGTSLWRDNYDAAIYGWLKDYRIFRLTEIPASLAPEEVA